MGQTGETWARDPEHPYSPPPHPLHCEQPPQQQPG